MWHYINQEQENVLKDIDFNHLLENIKKKLLDTGLDSLKTASKNVTHQIDPFWAKKTADAVTNSNDKKTVKSKPAEETDIPQEKQRSKINRIKTSIIKMEHYTICKLLNDSTVAKYMTENGSK